MLENKYINFIIAVIIVLALLFTSVIVLKPEILNSAESSEPEYIREIFDQEQVNEINIEIDEDDWEWLLENAAEEEYRSCDITVNGTTFNNVGIRPKGNSSLNRIASSSTTDRFSFKLNFDEYVDGQTCFGLSKIALNNIMSDKSYMKEYLSYDLLDYMGVPSPACAYVNIKVNSEEWGLYLAVEVIEESFVERQFGCTNCNLYKPESMEIGVGGRQLQGEEPDVPAAELQPNARDAADDGVNLRDKQGNLKLQPDIKDVAEAENNKQFRADNRIGGRNAGSGGANLKYNGDDASNYSQIRDNAVCNSTTNEDFEKVIEMLRNLNEGTNLEENLDTDEILRYIAVNTFLVNLDSYAGGMYHNYYLYEEDGIFQVLPWDYNQSFAGFGMNDSAKAINFPIDMPVTGNLEDAPLIGKLLEVPEYKETYHKYLSLIVEEYINSGVFEYMINKTDQLIDSYVKNDATAFYTYEDYKKAVPMMKVFGTDRAASITAQLAGEQPAAAYGNMNTALDLDVLGSMGGGGKNDFIDGAGIGNGSGMVEEPEISEPPGMGGISDVADRPSQGNMQRIMKIIDEAEGGKLSAEQTQKLKELGADDNMIDMLMSRGAMRDAGNLEKARPNMNNASAAPDTSFLIRNSMLILSFVSLLAGLLFVKKYKRKRYHT